MPPSVPAETVAFWENALQKVAESRSGSVSTGSLQRRAAVRRIEGFGQVLETTGLYAKLMADLGLIK